MKCDPIEKEPDCKPDNGDSNLQHVQRVSDAVSGIAECLICHVGLTDQEKKTALNIVLRNI